MIDLLDLIVFSVLMFGLALFLVTSIRLHFKNKALDASILEYEIVLMALSSKIDDIQKEKELEGSDGFIRFLSQSRESAFDYIDLAQESLKTFIGVADSMFKDQSLSEDVVKAYEAIKGLLPEDNLENRNGV